MCNRFNNTETLKMYSKLLQVEQGCNGSIMIFKNQNDYIYFHNGLSGWKAMGIV